jgi:hypothetical protein
LRGLTALYRVGQSIAKSPTASRVLVEVARELGAALPPVYEVSVSEWDRRRHVIRDIFEFKPRQNRRVAVPGHEFELRGCPSSRSCCAGRGSLVSRRDGVDTSAAQVTCVKRFGWQSVPQAPLVAGGRTLGVIEIPDIDEFRPREAHEIEFCETLASQAAMTLQQAELFERIRHMADHDAITGLANPRVFHRRAAAAERAARRHETPLGVLVLDIEDFKQINDERGHAHGDRVLCSTACVLPAPRARYGPRGSPGRRRARAAAAAHASRRRALGGGSAGAGARTRGHPRLDRARGGSRQRGRRQEPGRAGRSGAAEREAARQAARRARGVGCVP